jgi:acyl-CoA thioester hydrolase
MARPFRHPLRVRYHECDAQGVVFNANYVTYFDVAMTELWREAFGSYQVMLDRGLDMVVAEVTVRFRAPARFDDEVEVLVAVAHIGTTSMGMALEVRRAGGGELFAEGELRYVLVSHGTHAKTPVPDDMRAALARYAPAPEVAGPA